jgi:hypothetical protein
MCCGPHLVPNCKGSRHTAPYGRGSEGLLSRDHTERSWPGFFHEISGLFTVVRYGESGALLITSHLRVVSDLLLPWCPMFKLQRVIESGMVRLIVIGRIDAAQLPDLQDLVLSESASDVVLDLLEVTLVDSEVVRLLVQCETNGLRLVNCPAYIREWMGRESE